MNTINFLQCHYIHLKVNINMLLILQVSIIKNITTTAFKNSGNLDDQWKERGKSKPQSTNINLLMVGKDVYALTVVIAKLLMPNGHI